MNITLKINGMEHTIDAAPSITLLAAVRGLGFYGIKFGDEQGLSGADTVLLDGKPVNAGSMLAAQAEDTISSPSKGWANIPTRAGERPTGLHPLQQAFVEIGRDPVRVLHAGPDPGGQRRCSTKTRTRPRNKSGRRLRACCAAARAI